MALLQYINFYAVQPIAKRIPTTLHNNLWFLESWVFNNNDRNVILTNYRALPAWRYKSAPDGRFRCTNAKGIWGYRYVTGSGTWPLKAIQMPKTFGDGQKSLCEMYGELASYVQCSGSIQMPKAFGETVACDGQRLLDILWRPKMKRSPRQCRVISASSVIFLKSLHNISTLKYSHKNTGEI